MGEGSTPRDRLGRDLRSWAESVTAMTPDSVRSESQRLNRERRRRRQRALGGVVSVVVLSVGALFVVSRLRPSPVGVESATPGNSAPSRPEGCSVNARTFVDEFVSAPPALGEELPAGSTLSLADGTAFGESGLVRVLSIDTGTAVPRQALDALEFSGGFKVFVMERCGSLASIAVIAESIRSVVSAAGSNSHLASVSISLDEGRGLVVLTGPRVIADELVAEARVDADLIDFASSVSSAD
jgi:hypothetical protein